MVVEGVVLRTRILKPERMESLDEGGNVVQLSV